MMGASHAATGAAAWFALTATAPAALGWTPVDERLVLLGMVTTAGAALLPDWDHRQATISWSLPPVSNLICRGLEKLFGGHRAGTHSILGIAFFTVLAWAAGFATYTTDSGRVLQLGAGILGVFLGSLALGALKILRKGGYLGMWAVAIGFGAVVASFAPGNLWWLPASVGTGVAVHILGDMLTVGGVKLLWPVNSTNMAVPLLGRTGSAREWGLGVAVGLYVAYGFIWAGYSSSHTLLETIA
ncbi:metal-dependent hydrolase [Arthrobacter rhombi]|uniref:metal-dependent hydrolase n=1 Tax=Arthrobacter rhombi TaxID=71253 RepID=UPI003FD28B34